MQINDQNLNDFIAAKEKAPGPGNYSPKTNLNEDTISIFRSTGRTVFSKQPRNALDDRLYMNPHVPGPGNYQRISEFGGPETSNIDFKFAMG